MKKVAIRFIVEKPIEIDLDEAFLDVTANKYGIASATRIAQAIRRQIVHVTGGLTASAGVSFSKFLAKG